MSDFNADLVMSDGVAASSDVRDVLMDRVPGAMGVYRAHEANDRQGTDWWVEISNRHLAIDAKVRRSDWAATHPDEDDLALEVWSVKAVMKQGVRQRSCRQSIGWTLDHQKRTDYVLWLWQDTKRFCLVPFPMLCRVFTEHRADWVRDYRTNEQFTETTRGNGWFSECVFVPRRVVWAEIYRMYSPSIIAD